MIVRDLSQIDFNSRLKTHLVNKPKERLYMQRFSDCKCTRKKTILINRKVMQPRTIRTISDKKEPQEEVI